MKIFNHFEFVTFSKKLKKAWKSNAKKKQGEEHFAANWFNLL